MDAPRGALGEAKSSDSVAELLAMIDGMA